MKPQPQLGWELLSHLGAVIPTYPWDLSLEGFLSLRHSYIVSFLLGPIPEPLHLFPCPLHLFPCLLGLLQFLLKGNNLSFGGGQLIFGLTKEHPLALSLLLSVIQGGLSILFVPFFLDHFALHLIILFSAMLKAFTVAFRLPSSFFICWWQ